MRDYLEDRSVEQPDSGSFEDLASDSQEPLDSFLAACARGDSQEGAERTSGLPGVTAGLGPLWAAFGGSMVLKLLPKLRRPHCTPPEAA